MATMVKSRYKYGYAGAQTVQSIGKIHTVIRSQRYKNRAGTNRIPRERNFPYSNPPVKGMSISVPHLAAVKHIPGKMPVITICPASF